jgi:hypothetical protein
MAHSQLSIVIASSISQANSRLRSLVFVNAVIARDADASAAAVVGSADLGEEPDAGEDS